jgi:probable HAF family extracellular repeat protein
MLTLHTVARIAATAALMSTLMARAGPYTAVDLGAQRPGNSYANALNNKGEVVGAIWDQGTSTATVWSGNSVISLSPRPGAESGFALGINDDGQVVGASYPMIGGSTHAMTWKGTTVTDLAPAGTDPQSYSYAYDINRSGQIAGMANYLSAPAGAHATVWSAGASSDISTTRQRSEARAINNHGHVVGWSQVDQMSSTEATVWKDGIATTLSSSGAWSDAYDINDAGQIVGGTARSLRHSTRATLWAANGTSTDLGTLGGNASRAHAINEAGQIVGGAVGADNRYRAALWEGGTVTDLNQYLDPSLVAAGWVLTQATDINDLGAITANATLGGVTDTSRAFLLTPVPEPGTYAMLLVGLTLLVGSAKRQRMGRGSE